MAARFAIAIVFLVASGVQLAAAEETEIPSGLEQSPETSEISQGAPPATPRFGPIGVLDAHTLREGEWTLSYRFVRSFMDGIRDGKRRQSVGDVQASFSRVPTKLDAELHWIGVMYAPHDRFTLTVRLPVINRAMRHEGTPFSTQSDGVGDLKLTGLIPFMKKGDESIHLHFGLSTPTGSILKDDDTPSGSERLPYVMQLGSGTWDLSLGGTYLGQRGRASWGLQALGVIALGENDLGYAYGESYNITGWLAWSWNHFLASSLRMAWNDWGNVHGRDAALDPDRAPSEDPDRQDGERLDLGPGLRFALPGLVGQEIAIEALFPIYQKLDGPQIETDWTLNVGWQWSF